MRRAATLFLLLLPVLAARAEEVLLVAGFERFARNRADTTIRDER